MILTDVDLSKQCHPDLLYVGASRATDRLVVFEVASDALSPSRCAPPRHHVRNESFRCQDQPTVPGVQ